MTLKKSLKNKHLHNIKRKKIPYPFFKFAPPPFLYQDIRLKKILKKLPLNIR